MTKQAGCADVQRAACLPGTAWGESGRRASISREEDEEILLFRVDDAAVRGLFGGGPLCDLLFLYRETRSVRRTAVLVELKGRDLNHAVEQLGGALAAVRKCATREFDVEAWKAVAVVRGAVPRDVERLRKRFDAEYGVPLRVCSAKTCDLRGVGVLP